MSERLSDGAAASGLGGLESPQRASGEADSQGDEGVYRAIRWLVIVSAVGLVLGSLMRMPPIQNANDESRWATVWSLVERGTYAIDESPWVRTIDKIQREGHFYSSKPPLFSTIVAGGYWALKATLGWKLETHPRHVVYTLLTVVNVVPFAVLLFFFGNFLRRTGCGIVSYAFCMLAAGIGTFLTAYNLTLTNHTAGMWACFFVAYLVWRISAARFEKTGESIANSPSMTTGMSETAVGGRSRAIWYGVAGLLAGFLPSVDLLAAPFCACVFGWLLWLDRRMTLRVFLPAAIVPIIAFFVTNWFVMEGFFPAYALKHDSDLYRYPGSFWSNLRGIAANKDSNGFYLFNMMIGHHGWFSHTPIFLIGLAAMLRRPRGGPPGLPWFNGLVLLMFIGVSAFFATNQSRDYGGSCHGFRWMFWMTPLWLMAMPPMVERMAASSAGRIALGAALLVSVFSVGYALSGPWGTSWVHGLFRYWGIVSY